MSVRVGDASLLQDHLGGTSLLLLERDATLGYVRSVPGRLLIFRTAVGGPLFSGIENRATPWQRVQRSPAVAVCERGTKNPYTAEDNDIDTSGTWWADT